MVVLCLVWEVFALSGWSFEHCQIHYVGIGFRHIGGLIAIFVGKLSMYFALSYCLMVLFFLPKFFFYWVLVGEVLMRPHISVFVRVGVSH